MTRREAIKKTAWLTGCAVSATAVSAVFSGCQADHSETWNPKLLSQSQYEAVSDLAEIMLPKTDTPGAKDVYVGRFIDEMLAEFYGEKERISFLEGLNTCLDSVDKKFNKKIADLSHEEVEISMNILMVEAQLAENENSNEEDVTPFFLQLKHLCMLGYFTSEEISKNVLVFDPVPGDYEGCYPLEKTGGRTWAI